MRKPVLSDKACQFVRFSIIGTCAAAVHYGIYFLLQLWMDVNVAYTAGYVISFVGNFYATNYFTFHTMPTWRNFTGFAGSHAVNYVLHIVLFNLFLWMGIHRLIAPPLVMLVAMLVQFTILRFVFVNSESEKRFASEE
jgi:putative flippase GtrA